MPAKTGVHQYKAILCTRGTKNGFSTLIASEGCNIYCQPLTRFDVMIKRSERLQHDYAGPHTAIQINPFLHIVIVFVLYQTNSKIMKLLFKIGLKISSKSKPLDFLSDLSINYQLTGSQLVVNNAGKYIY